MDPINVNAATCPPDPAVGGDAAGDPKQRQRFPVELTPGKM